MDPSISSGERENNSSTEDELVNGYSTNTMEQEKYRIENTSGAQNAEKMEIRPRPGKDEVKKNHEELKELSQQMLSGSFPERRDIEQYFWTEKTINEILEGLRYTFGVEASCCLCTPTLAHAWWVEGEAVNLLDIDTRFNYLPKFRYFDLRCPKESVLPESEQNNWRVIVFDPPFFYISMEHLYQAVLHVCKGKVERTKLLIGFLKRNEKELLEKFHAFSLKRTSFALEYTHVKPNKWRNYAMYSNVDIPGIKRLVK